MLHKYIKILLLYVLYAAIATAIGWYVPVLICDVWRLECAICR